MKNHHISRREFVITGFIGTLGIASGFTFREARPVVSVVRIKGKKIAYAVEHAIDLLGTDPVPNPLEHAPHGIGNRRNRRSTGNVQDPSPFPGLARMALRAASSTSSRTAARGRSTKAPAAFV